jgi:uncharacterized protein Yka (UPF0111/DUF47 family)
MSKKKGNNYFKMLKGLAESTVQAAAALESILTDFRLEALDGNMEKLHGIEHGADEKKHDLIKKLAKEFITPIEREDIMDITDLVDDVTDAIEDVLLKLYMFNIKKIKPEALKFIGIIKKCCNKLLNVFNEFENYKKPKALFGLIVELNLLEEKGDELYIKVLRDLYTSDLDVKEIIAWTEIYGVMETVCDTCEHVADVVEHVVMKNS